MFYNFGNEIRVQKKGGPIGLSLTGDIAECVMIHWDKKFLTELKKVGINLPLYKRFKDDITLLVEALQKGTIFEGGKLTINEDKKITDNKKNDEEVTMEIIKEIANQIDPMIQFTIDIPSNHPN